MPFKDGITPSGNERARSARISPSDIADAKQQAARDAADVGRRMLSAIVDTRDDAADVGPLPDA